MKSRFSYLPVILVGILAVAIGLGLYLIRSGLTEQYVAEDKINVPASPSDEPEAAGADSAPQKLAIVGDSYSGGSGEGGKGDKGWPALVTQRLKGQGFDVDMSLSGISGSGYVAQGPSGITIGQEAAQLVRPDDNVVVFFGSVNDAENAATSPDALATAVSDTLAATHKTAPNAKILVVNPPYNPLAPADQQQALLAVRDILKKQADAANAVFVDSINAGWFADRPELFGAFHPNDDGHVYLADQFDPLIAPLLHKSAT